MQFYESPEQEHAANRHKAQKQLKYDCGRFFGQSLETYKAEHASQSKVVKRLAGCVERIDEFVDSRVGLVLWGRIGTGKDHLICSVLRAAADIAKTVRWIEGLELYTKASSAWKDGTRDSYLNQFLRCDVLAISDPVFIRNWSPAKAETLAEVVRSRYDAGKRTWITANAKDLAQLREMCVPDVYDRLTERAVVEHCSWGSYRQEQQISF